MGVSPVERMGRDAHVISSTRALVCNNPPTPPSQPHNLLTDKPRVNVVCCNIAANGKSALTFAATLAYNVRYEVIGTANQ
jgi:hypothetical protein